MPWPKEPNLPVWYLFEKSAQVNNIVIKGILTYRKLQLNGASSFYLFRSMYLSSPTEKKKRYCNGFRRLSMGGSESHVTELFPPTLQSYPTPDKLIWEITELIWINSQRAGGACSVARQPGMHLLWISTPKRASVTAARFFSSSGTVLMEEGKSYFIPSPLFGAAPWPTWLLICVDPATLLCWERLVGVGGGWCGF